MTGGALNNRSREAIALPVPSIHALIQCHLQLIRSIDLSIRSIDPSIQCFAQSIRSIDSSIQYFAQSIPSIDSSIDS